jgi:hypothetical protein
MNSKITGVLIFAAGAAIGVVATRKYFETKYAQIAQEEIDSIKEVYGKKMAEIEEGGMDISEPEVTEEDVEEYKDCIRDNGYSEPSDEVTAIPVPTPVVETEPTNEPYVISPVEYGEIEGYTLIGYTYYDDCVLADENDEMVEDVDSCVGWESLKHFGDYESDAVHVRNDRLRCDYEILRDPRKYSEVLEKAPYIMKDWVDSDDE